VGCHLRRKVAEFAVSHAPHNHYSNEAGLGPSFVSMFARDQDGIIWAATSSGLERLEDSHWTRIDSNRNYPAAKADSVYVDRQGTLAVYYVVPNMASSPWCKSGYVKEKVV
jgi:hypothetical protein